MLKQLLQRKTTKLNWIVAFATIALTVGISNIIFPLGDPVGLFLSTAIAGIIGAFMIGPLLREYF